jgi:integrase/recombinase XerD
MKPGAPTPANDQLFLFASHLHAHLALKEAALAKLKPYQGGKRTRFRPNDRLLAFLEAL